MASFPLLSEGEDIRGVVGWLVAVQGDIAGGAEGDHEFAQFGHVGQGSADAGGAFQQQELVRDGPAGASGGVRGLGGKEAPAALQVRRCAFRDDYSWHSGAVVSSSVPQVFNQACASSPVRCRPFSW